MTAARGAPDVRFALGVAGLVASGLPVRDHSIGPLEAATFRSVNALPDRLYRSVWVLMQAGNASTPHVVGLLALATGRRRLALRVAASGAATWMSAKLVKRIYRRPRPAALVADVRCRGPEQSGLGYVSGHAGIATVLAVALAPRLRSGRAVALAAPAVVGLCRIYVGAHLPLDVVGCAALGLAVDAIVDRILPAFGAEQALRHGESARTTDDGLGRPS